MISDKDLVKQFQKHYGISKSGCKNQWRHIQECQAFYAGDYMNYKEEYAFGRGSSRRVKEVQFNRVKPYVNSMVGFAAQMRRKPDYQAAMENLEEQQALTDYLNGYSDYIRDNCNAVHMETLQDKDLFIGGIGITDTAITLKMGEATRTPSGEILEDRVDPLHAGWDPSASMPNKLDSKWVYRAKDYDTEEAMELLDAEEEDFEFVNPDDDVNNFEFNPYGGIQDKIGFEYADSNRQQVRVYFYQWYGIEKFYRAQNPLLKTKSPEVFEALVRALESVGRETEDEMFMFDPTAEMLIITKSKRSQVKGIFDAFNIPFNPITDKRRVYYTAALSGDKVFQKYKSVSQQGFSLKFKTGDYDSKNKIHTGVVASMRDPQRYYNKSLTELLLIIASNARGGVMYEESAVDNIQEFEASWAMFNSATRVADGAISGGKIQPKALPHLNTGYEGIVQESSQALSKVTGVDDSFFGAIAGGNETAMLQRQRIKQATTTLACYFDAIELYTKEQARMMLSFMRLLAESSEGQMFRTFDPNGKAVFERISLDYFVDEYVITIGEMPETPAQKEYYTQTLIQMGQSMQTIGDPRYTQMYAAAVDHMPLPERDKNKIKQILVGEQQIDPQLVKQMQEKIQQLEGEQSQLISSKMMADIQKTNADTQEKIVSAQKKAAEIEGVGEDTEKKAIENDIMAAKNYRDVNVTI